MQILAFLAVFAVFAQVLTLVLWLANRRYRRNLQAAYDAGKESADLEHAISDAESGAPALRVKLEAAKQLLERYRGPGGIQEALVADRDQWLRIYNELQRTHGNFQHLAAAQIRHLIELIPRGKQYEINPAMVRARQEFDKVKGLKTPELGVPCRSISEAEYKSFLDMPEGPPVASPDPQGAEDLAWAGVSLTPATDDPAVAR